MRIAVLYICTGVYSQFFEGFYHSAEKFFLPGEDKEYFVWTDHDDLGDLGNNIHIYHRECAGFPADSLFRFEMFLEAKSAWMQLDYVYFFNANMEFKQVVGPEILPDDRGLVSAYWPGRRMTEAPMFHPYERNKASLAYIAPHDPPYHYYMAGLNGGNVYLYSLFVEELAHNIRDDYDRGIVARVHDESHINKYFHSHPSKVMPKEYCWPEEWPISGFEPKVILRDKVRLNSYYNKGRKRSFLAYAKKGWKKIYNAVSWYF